VLHLWPNQVLVSLGIEHIEVILRNGFNKHIIQQREVDVSHAKIKDWSNAIQQVDAVLSELKLTEKTRLSVTLTSDLVRFIALPPQAMVVNNDEKLAYAKASYQETYGAISADWVIKCHPAAPHQTTICAAIDQRLLDSIEALAVKYHLKLNAVQPYFMNVFNRFSNQLNQSNQLLIIVEFNHIVIANIAQGQCQQIRNVKVSEYWQTTLEQTLAREKLLGHYENDQVMLYIPMKKLAKLPSIEGWSLKQIYITNKNTGKAKPTAMLEALA
jgi:hypothetical protein